MNDEDENKEQSTNVTDYFEQSVPGTDCLTGIESMEDLVKKAAAGTLTLPPLTGGGFSSSLGSFTVNAGGTSSSYSYPYISQSTPISGAAPYGYGIGNGITNGYPWSPSTQVKITNSGMEMDDGCDIKIGDLSLKSFMKSVGDRLAILQPNPDKLEKFEALRQAYEHYKTLEALCQESDPKEDK